MNRADRNGGRGNETMKLSAIMTAALIITGAAAPSFALEAVYSSSKGGVSLGGLVQSVSCNVNDEDKQALCMRTCDDEYIKSSQAYGTAGRLEGPKEAKKACEKKCGC
jgi:hypothetical protein